MSDEARKYVNIVVSNNIRIAVNRYRGETWYHICHAHKHDKKISLRSSEMHALILKRKELRLAGIEVCSAEENPEHPADEGKDRKRKEHPKESNTPQSKQKMEKKQKIPAKRVKKESHHDKSSYYSSGDEEELDATLSEEDCWA
jgi:hypothetical protein